ncbi:hypothetical protein [Helicobacter sp.]|uniref:hypothetical protein n=1 Tax=Helicobacter sp. TaxID=218 RepID=UPI0025BFA871|nr:hypothetical protein [Helicobacter sp.]MBR2494358.1 hypothetical protein [Helicobacter sp.]
MKGLFSKLAIVAAVAVLFSACGDDKKAEEAAPQTTVEEQVTENPVVSTDTTDPETNTEANEQTPEANAETTQASADQNADEAVQASTEEANEQTPEAKETK